MSGAGHPRMRALDPVTTLSEAESMVPGVSGILSLETGERVLDAQTSPGL
jgi:hypothetical protein